MFDKIICMHYFNPDLCMIGLDPHPGDGNGRQTSESPKTGIVGHEAT